MFSNEVVGNLAGGSAIRAMFEQGALLRKQYGDANVYDFALGNPDPEPPQKVLDQMKELADQKDIHKYMANAGFEDVRSKIAAYESGVSGVKYTASNVVMVCGAAAGINIVMKSILNPGDEVIVNAPFFGEYRFYTQNYGGKIVIVKTLPDTFQLDIPGIMAAITPATKAIILNSPNNPSGAVYPREDLEKLSKELKALEAKTGNPIYIISDEPYVKIKYDGVEVPSMPSIFDNTIVVNSFSKSLALPGERIGYVLVSPKIKDVDVLVDCLIFANRTLGYVNAPGLFQKVVADNLEEVAGLESYLERRDALYDIITKAGFECSLPKGAFYLFAKIPENVFKKSGDQEGGVLFGKMALDRHIVLVNGAGFAYPGYFRLAYCVSMDTIKNSAEAFAQLRKDCEAL